MGVIPPLSDADWVRAFEAYRATTEFQEQNAWMTLEDFRPIYWWEWAHRQLGRLIGLVWVAGPPVVSRDALGARGLDGAGWCCPGCSGGAQAAVGWWMVASGLTGRLDVAPYRLALHLGLAFAIFALLAWLALRVRLDEVATLAARRRRIGRVMSWTGWLGALVFVQILSGALVAGLDAGRGYVDWPLMEGQLAAARGVRPLAPSGTTFSRTRRSPSSTTASSPICWSSSPPSSSGGARTGRRAVRRWVMLTGAGDLRADGGRHLHGAERRAARARAAASGRGADRHLRSGACPVRRRLSPGAADRALSAFAAPIRARDGMGRALSRDGSAGAFSMKAWIASAVSGCIMFSAITRPVWA